MREIVCGGSGGGVVLVDDEDYERVAGGDCARVGECGAMTPLFVIFEDCDYWWPADKTAGHICRLAFYEPSVCGSDVVLEICGARLTWQLFSKDMRDQKRLVRIGRAKFLVSNYVARQRIESDMHPAHADIDESQMERAGKWLIGKHGWRCIAGCVDVIAAIKAHHVVSTGL